MEQKKKTDHEWLKTLLVSIIGTFVGVSLTFFADRMVERRQQKKAQRETAIMAVCDIDEIIQKLKEEKQMEDSLYHVAFYVSTHPEDIESISYDSLLMAFNYVYENRAEVKPWTIDTKENTFNSGMDARMNLGNNQFYDNVQSCYYFRRKLMKVMEDGKVFQRPLTEEGFEQLVLQLKPEDLDSYGTPTVKAEREIVKQVFEQKKTLLYLSRVFYRRDSYVGAIRDLERLNKENKLLMDISDKEIEEYLNRNSAASFETPTEDMLEGTWDYDMNDNKQTYIFHQGGAAELIVNLSIDLNLDLREENMHVTVPIPHTIHIDGRWELADDSLKTVFDKESAKFLSFKLDLSHLPQSFLEREKDNLETTKGEIKAEILQTFKTNNELDHVYDVSIDKSGNNMTLTRHMKGEKEPLVMLLTRKQE